MHTKKKKTYTMKTSHKVALFFVYLILFLAIFGMIDYYAYDILNPWIFIVASFGAALWATAVHVRKHTKTKADEIAREIEEIL